MKPDSFEYYEYILCYVYDVLYISHNLRKPMKIIQEDLNIKEDKIRPPDVSLGSTLANTKLESVKEKYIDQIGWPIHLDNGSTKERGTTGKFYILRGKLEYVGFLP